MLQNAAEARFRTESDRMIEQDPKAWEEGFEAGEKRKNRCPYPEGSREEPADTKEKHASATNRQLEW
jgi:hypothetical protein